MALEDRDYLRDSEGESTTTWRGQFTGMSVTMWLLLINVVIYFVDRIMFGSMRAHDYSPTVWGAFSFNDFFGRWQLWRLGTYQFLHSPTDFLHILFNMMVLLSFGPIIERWWGKWRFLAFYLLCGISGAFMFSVLCLFPGLIGLSKHATLVGASGSIFGLLIAAATLYPRQNMRVMFLPIELRLRVVAGILFGITLLSLLVGAQNAGGEAAHLGGLVTGFMLIRFPGVLGFVPQEFSFRLASNRGAFEKKRARELEAEQRENAEVDRILDKVRANGLHSLTKAEQKALQRATDRQRRAS